MNKLENLKKGDVITNNKQYHRIEVVDDNCFFVLDYMPLTYKELIEIKVTPTSRYVMYTMEELIENHYTIYTPEPDIKYWSNGAVRSGMKEGQEYYYIDDIGMLSKEEYRMESNVDRFRTHSKMIFMDWGLCKIHGREILDRQALEQKVWEIMDGKSEKEKESWFFLRVTEQDSEVYHYQVNGWCIDHNDEYDTNTPKITKKAGDYLLSNEVTDYQRALWIEDWELAREYKSKE
jgi:hypothetical protein